METQIAGQMPEYDAAIHLTGSAARKVRELIDEEGRDDLALRVYINGGGCSGFQYGFAFEETPDDDDLRVVQEGVTVLIDPISLQYLEGAELDYSESLRGAQFVVRNPKAKSTCGCGSSFSI